MAVPSFCAETGKARKSQRGLLEAGTGQGEPGRRPDPPRCPPSATELVLGARVRRNEAEDSGPLQAQHTVGAQLKFVDERMNKARTQKGFKKSASPGIKRSKSLQGLFM